MTDLIDDPLSHERVLQNVLAKLFVEDNAAGRCPRCCSSSALGGRTHLILLRSFCFLELAHFSRLAIYFWHVIAQKQK